jgi:ribulose-bisphosphate carboxylase small chain
MLLRHGAFSYLPDLTDEEISAQVRYVLDRNWPVSIEYTDDPHPRNVYWEMWGLPMFDLDEPDGVLSEINECRRTFPNHYVRVLAYDASLGRQTTGLSFLVQRPAEEPGFRLDRTEAHGRVQRYALHPYSTEVAPGSRYKRSDNGSS